MDRFQEMQIFMGVADDDGFGTAARCSSVTRAIASLVPQLSCPLCQFMWFTVNDVKRRCGYAVL